VLKLTWYLCLPDPNWGGDPEPEPYLRSQADLERNGLPVDGPFVFTAYRIDGAELVPVVLHEERQVRYRIEEPRP
jgi:hypothetical protein